MTTYQGDPEFSAQQVFQIFYRMKFQILTATGMNIAVFWNVVPWGDRPDDGGSKLL
jgi:hypothetical protein